jgi:uncharacterized membrane protein YbhN (UPF0104 family)
VAFFVELPPGGVRLGGVDLLAAGQRAAATGIALGVVGVVGLAVAGGPGVRVLEAAARRVFPPAAPPIARLGFGFVQGFRSLASRPLYGAVALVCTVGIWTGTLAAVALLMAGFEGLTPTVDLVLLNWSATLTAVVLVPTPGHVGAFEAGCVASLALVDVPVGVAQTFAVVSHAIMFSFTVTTGALALALEGWSLGSLVRASERAR